MDGPGHETAHDVFQPGPTTSTRTAAAPARKEPLQVRIEVPEAVRFSGFKCECTMETHRVGVFRRHDIDGGLRREPSQQPAARTQRREDDVRLRVQHVEEISPPQSRPPPSAESAPYTLPLSAPATRTSGDTAIQRRQGSDVTHVQNSNT